MGGEFEGKQLQVVLSYLMGRQVKQHEITTALEIDPRTYRKRRDDGTLIDAEHLIKAGMGLGVDTALLLRGYGFLEEAQVFDKLASIRRRIENLQKLHSH
jgi:hypothetical protein